MDEYLTLQKKIGIKFKKKKKRKNLIKRFLGNFYGIYFILVIAFFITITSPLTIEIK